MAILNWMQPGTYSTVKISQYDKHQKVINIEVETFSDSSKTYQIQNTNFIFMVGQYKTLLSKGWSAPPAVEHNLYDSYFVTGQGEGAWSMYNNQVPAWYADHWEPGLQPYDKQIVYFSDEELYYMFRESDSTWVLLDQSIPMTDARWDSFFALEVLDQDGNNIIKAAYEYLHTLPQFASTTPG